MRIAFCGAAGTGKTTLTEWISTEWGLPINPIGSRSVAKAMGFENPYDVDAAGKRAEFQQRLLDEKLAWEAAHEDFVTDRALFDNLAYTALHSVRSITPEQVLETFSGFQRYEVVFFCPMGAFQHTGDDPMRVHDHTYHFIFETLIHGWLKLGKVAGKPEYHELWYPTLERRKNYIREALGKR